MMRALLICVVMLIGAAAAHAETGRSDAPREHSVLEAVDAPPLSALDRDVFRFSKSPSLGGRGYIITVVGKDDGPWAEIVWLYGHPYSGWEVTRRERLELRPSEYERLSSIVDEELRRGEPDPDQGEGRILVCGDGPGYLTERLMDGSQSWMSGQCGQDHPNDVLANVLFDWLLDRLGGD